MANIRIKIGVALDSKTETVFTPLDKAAERSRKKLEREMTAAAREADKIAKAAKKAADQVEKEMAKAAKAVDKVAKAEGDAASKLDRELEAMANKILRDEEKSQKARTKVVEREAKARARAESQAAKEGAAAAAGGARAEQRAAREAEAAVARLTRAEQREAAQASRANAAFKRNVGRGLSASLHLIRGGASLAMGGAETLLQGVGVDMSLASHMANAVDFQQRITDVTNAGYIPGAAGAQGQMQDKGAVGNDVRAAANAGAFGYNEAAEGLQKFVGLTGDLETGRTALKSIAELARATGSDFVKMAEASAEVSNHMGSVPNKAEAVSSIMRVIAGQGKLGALEIKDFARQMAKIAANAPMFEGNIGKTIGELGLIAQEAKMQGGAASASQAATSVLAFASDFSKKTTFKNWHDVAGINPYTDDKHTLLRRPEELILKAIEYTRGDQTKLAQLFPSRMAQRAVKPFAAVFNETHGTDKQKIDAVAAEFDRMRMAQLDAITVQEALADSMATTKSKAQLANNKLDDMAREITTAMLPAIAGLVPALEAMLPAVTALVGWFAEALGNLTQSTSLDQQHGALKAQADAQNFHGTMQAFERSNMAQNRGPRSDAEVDIGLARAAPILDAESKKEDELKTSIGGYESTVQKEKNEFMGASEETIKKIASGSLFFRPGGEAEASKYEADKATLDRLKSALEGLQKDRTDLLDAITSGRMIVTVANMPKPDATPPPPTPGGSAGADSEP